jgi:hypothetical protein
LFLMTVGVDDDARDLRSQSLEYPTGHRTSIKLVQRHKALVGSAHTLPETASKQQAGHFAGINGA